MFLHSQFDGLKFWLAPDADVRSLDENRYGDGGVEKIGTRITFKDGRVDHVVEPIDEVRGVIVDAIQLFGPKVAIGTTAPTQEDPWLGASPDVRPSEQA